MSEKTKGELLQEKLLMKPENLGQRLDEHEIEDAEKFCERYKDFLDKAKTERDAVEYILGLLGRAGYRPFVHKLGYKPGDKVYINNRGKAVIAATIGRKGIGEGLRIVASHIDAPRLDLKPRPLFEESQLAYFKTHYYGGIKKYQWTAIPLALHGVIVKKDGSQLKVRIGEAAGDPVFCVTDLLPHLAREQMKKTMADGIAGEQLNIIVGCTPYRDEKVSEKVKLRIAELIYDKYGITEDDLLSAELCAVPAFGARDVGLDRGMIGAYGHDDRVCAYTSLMAELEAESPEFTTVTVFADKEETGSEGPTGLDSYFLRDFIEDLAIDGGSELRHVLASSVCISADVSAAFDPAFADVSEKRNAAYINYGAVLMKYCGSGGKYSTNDASAETMALMRSLLDNANVPWQCAELGRVDAGGGGTVAKYIAHLNVDTVDIGVPVLSMHSPFELVSKLDVYATYKAMATFLK